MVTLLMALCLSLLTISSIISPSPFTNLYIHTHNKTSAHSNQSSYIPVSPSVWVKHSSHYALLFLIFLSSHWPTCLTGCAYGPMCLTGPLSSTTKELHNQPGYLTDRELWLPFNLWYWDVSGWSINCFRRSWFLFLLFFTAKLLLFIFMFPCFAWFWLFMLVWVSLSFGGPIITRVCGVFTPGTLTAARAIRVTMASLTLPFFVLMVKMLVFGRLHWVSW